MSFRELRNLTEIMRALEYPRLISVDNFRTPNFELVADALYWLVKRYDPDINISDNIESENDRVEFLIGATEAMLNKAHIQLNPRRLYSADGLAVRELLKIANVLYQASRAEVTDHRGDLDDGNVNPLTSQLSHVKDARHLATEITEKGARLYDLLGKEKDARRARIKAIAFLDAVSGNLSSTSEHQYIESSLREIVANTQENIDSLKKQCEDLSADERALDAKIKKKQGDLERNEKRLKSLQTHRPAFADELEKLEGELQRYYDLYMERFRNLDYLEHELDQYHKEETVELEEYQRRRNRQAEKIRKEQLIQFIGREPESESAIAEEMSRVNSGPKSGPNSATAARPKGPTATQRTNGAGPTSAPGKQKPAGRGTAGKEEQPGGGRSSRSSSEGSGSDLNDSEGSSSGEEVSLNDSEEESESIIDDDDETSEGAASRSSEGTNDEDF